MPYQTGIRLLCVTQNPANGFPARLLVMLLLHTLSPMTNDVWQSVIPYEFSDTVALGAVISLITPLLGNKIWKEEMSAVQAAEDNGDRIELLLMEAIRREHPLEITLKTGKSYIGRALRACLQSLQD